MSPVSTVSMNRFEQVVCGQIQLPDLDIDELADLIEQFNAYYREGKPVISDHRYDQLMSELAVRDPNHPLLHRVEPEPEESFGGKRVRLTSPMLSLDKAYTVDEIERFLERIQIAAEELGINGGDIRVQATAKLDGLAGVFDGVMLCSRGDGNYGQDISVALQRGVVPRGNGNFVGEIVVEQDYFNRYLAEDYEHPRNFVVGVVGADELSDTAMAALKAGVVRFVSYASLPSWQGQPEEFLTQHVSVFKQLKDASEYKTDGIVLEVTNTDIRLHLGTTIHHPRYAIAIKERGETAETVVQSITWQVGRSGRITPVLEVSPVRLSGATISRITAHHAAMVKMHSLGPGARIRAIRAGEVIPALDAVLQPAGSCDLPDGCPCCGHTPEWDGDKFLNCPNTAGCSAQVENSIEHFFSIIGTADLFGPKSIERLVSGGYKTLEAIYSMRETDFTALGFGDGQAANLVRELKRSRKEEIEDWRFLAAFGIRHLGRGDSRKLLQQIRIEELGTITPERIRVIHGFGELTSPLIAEQLAARWPTILYMLDFDFNLHRTPLLSESTQSVTPIGGKGIVFTGSMLSASREDMEAKARSLGANVQSSVNRKTDYLVCGEKVGASKTNKAKEIGVKIITEKEYLTMVGV